MTAARFRLIYVLVAAIVISAAIFPSFAGPTATAQAPLFSDTTGQPALADGAFGRAVVRNRYVDVNFPQLDAAVRTPASQSSALQMNLFPFVSNLFPDVSITAVRDRVEATRSGQGVIWLGRAQGVADSAITLVSEGGVLVGNIQVGNRFYQIRYAGNGVHAIQEVNSRLYPDEQPPLQLTAPGAAPLPSAAGTSAIGGRATGAPASGAKLSSPSATGTTNGNPLGDNGSTIDVLVLYSQGALAAAGGTTAAINNLITLMESETNQGYAQSNVTQRLRVVQRQQVNSAEGSTNQTYLDQMLNPSDGVMDEVPGLRNATGADLVFLLQSVVADPCGQAAMILNPVSTSQAPDGYAVGEEDCSTGAGGWTFGHELGHLMGARHDWGSDPTNNAPFTYNHGYIQPGPNRSCSLMAVRGACSAVGNNRANYWSNPNILVNGLPIGIPEGQPNAAENWKTLNNTASTVANFRACVVQPCDVPPTVGPPPPTATSTPTPNPTATTTSTPSPISTPVVSCNPRPKVTVNAQPSGANTLQVTLLPGANGWINQVQIGAATNARIDIAGQTGVTGNQTFTLPPATTSLTFFVHHATTGQATTVPLTVVDTCGAWPTFVGGGANAF